jgi:phenylpropionate dioxygenase-like ring-hydroxylating dioxygenase large terminal subunit
MFLMNAWYVAAWPEEIAPSALLARTICGEPVVMFRGADGALAALEDRCCHRHYPLSKGKVCGDRLQCGYHGFEFDASGACVRVPSQRIVPEGARVRRYPIVERHNLVWIWMGAPEAADAAKIVDFGWLASPAWRWKGTRYAVNASYELVIENLMDLTHITFVHASTIGNYALIDQAEVKTARTESEVTVTRWMENSDPPPTYVKAGGFTGKVDRWQIIRYALPSTVRLSVGAMDVGAGARAFMGDGFAPHAPRTNGIGMFNFNMITPETERTTHYFWAQGHDFRLDDPALTELVFAQVEIAFKEDWAVFEAIQRNLDQKPDAPRVDVNGDAGGIQAIRLLRRAIEAERAAGLRAVA